MSSNNTKTVPVQIRLSHDMRESIENVRGDKSIAEVVRLALDSLFEAPCSKCQGTGKETVMAPVLPTTTGRLLP